MSAGAWFAVAYVAAMYVWYYYAWGRQFLDYLTTKFLP